MKKISLVLLCISSFVASAQTDSLEAVTQILTFQKKLNEEFKNREDSPLPEKEFAKFESHDFFPIDLAYRVKAKLSPTEGTPFFGMKTTTSRFSTERIYGYVVFTLANKEFRLPVYQSKDLMQTPEYADYLFFPFTDETNGTQTYGGGRYIDLRIPKEGDNLIIDFNTAYNPSCAYSPNFSCPIVPAENQMDVAVTVGIRYHQKDKPKTPDLESPDFLIADNLDVPPQYPGGYDKLVKFVAKNMTYPKAARKQKLKGVVYVQFVVDRDGLIKDVKALKGLSHECDREAVRVVSMMPQWKPGKKDGENVAVRYVLPIKFVGRPGWK